MIPHGAPTTRFSTTWHSSARSLPWHTGHSTPGLSPRPFMRVGQGMGVARGASRWIPKAVQSARIAATSTAAEELTPFPSGTSKWHQ